jgi:hypothetical protein
MPHGTQWIDIIEMAFPEQQEDFFRALNRVNEARRQAAAITRQYRMAAAQEDAGEEHLLTRLDRGDAPKGISLYDGMSSPHTFTHAELLGVLQAIQAGNRDMICEGSAKDLLLSPLRQ